MVASVERMAEPMRDPENFEGMLRQLRSDEHDWASLEMSRHIADDEHLETTLRFRSGRRTQPTAKETRLESFVKKSSLFLIESMEEIGEDVQPWKDRLDLGVSEMEDIMDHLRTSLQLRRLEKEQTKGPAEELEKISAEYQSLVEKAQNERDDAQKKGHEMLREKSELEERLKELTTAKHGLEQESEDYRAKTMQLREEIAQKEKEVRSLGECLSDERKEKEKLSGDLEKERQEAVEKVEVVKEEGEQKLGFSEAEKRREEEMKQLKQSLAQKEAKSAAQAQELLNELKNKDRESAKDKETMRKLRQHLEETGQLGAESAQMILTFMDEKAQLLEKDEELQERIWELEEELGRYEDQMQMSQLEEADGEVADESQIEDVAKNAAELCCLHPDLAEMLKRILRNVLRPLSLKIRVTTLKAKRSAASQPQATVASTSAVDVGAIGRETKADDVQYAQRVRTLMNSYSTFELLSWLSRAELDLGRTAKDLKQLLLLSGSLLPELRTFEKDLMSLLPTLAMLRRRVEGMSRSQMELRSDSVTTRSEQTFGAQMGPTVAKVSREEAVRSHFSTAKDTSEQPKTDDDTQNEFL